VDDDFDVSRAGMNNLKFGYEDEFNKEEETEMDEDKRVAFWSKRMINYTTIITARFSFYYMI
jgi:hypothetical protein